MTRKGIMGRPTIFRGKVKDSDHRVDGYLTKHGLALFATARRHLRELYRASTGKDLGQISHSDTVEFLLRGERETAAHIEREK